MTHKSNRILSVSLIGALLMIGGASSVASAGGPREQSHHGYRQPAFAGRIMIDGHWTSIRSDRPMLRQIAGAFRKAGYHVRIADGCILVDYGYSRPRVRWSRDSYNAQIHWEHHGLSISLRRYDPHAYRGHGWDRGHRQPIHVARRTYRWGGYCD